MNDVGRGAREALHGVLTDGVLIDGVRGVDLPSNLPDDEASDGRSEEEVEGVEERRREREGGRE